MSFRTAYGHAYSENGWRMCNRDECVIVDGPYMNTAPLRKGAPAVILGEFVRRHHVKVEPITSSVWGWSLYNDVANSNHLAGTSIDINAPKRPWKRLVLSKAIIDKTYALLNEFTVDGVSGIKWGREWNTPDEMHFQLRWPEGDARNTRLMNAILGNQSSAPAQPPVSYAPVLRYGSSGASVSKLQSGLNKVFPGYSMMPLAVDGDFGPNTQAAVKEFQRRTKLDPDGIVGPLTWAELRKYGIKP